MAVGKTYPLTVRFGEATAHTVGRANATVALPRAEKTIDLTIEVTSADFDLPPFPQQVRLKRDGRSTRAHFDITPLHDGESRLTVIVTAKGNFVQRLDLTFDVGADTTPTAAGYGRPAGAAAVLDERVASLQITAEDWGYELIALRVSPDPIRVEVTPIEIGARIAAVRDALLEVVSRRQIALEMDVAPDDNATILGELAWAGFRLYQTVFENSSASPELLAVGKWLRDALAHDEVQTLQVVSRGFPVPWALMYLTEQFDRESLTWDDFIGMRHVIEQIPMARIAAAPPPVTIDSAPELTVRAVFNDDIDAQMPSRPVAEQRRYWSARGVALTEGTSADDLLRDALAPGAHDKVLYLFCHAVADDSDTDKSRFVLTGNERVTLGELQGLAPVRNRLESHPLVFINACESGNLTPNFYDGFVSYFLGKGARGVVGTECKTPGLFASEWAKVFFDELFAGRPLGDAVLHTRRYFLDKHNNPLGLLYGVHCDADTVVSPALAST